MSLLTLETKKYLVKIDNFEGPLDLLCYLIDKNKMDIYDIKISEIADQYIAYIKQMEQENLEVTSEFLVMASELLYIKSKGLLPSPKEEEDELTEEQLLQRIIEYKKYKEITKKLKEHFETYSKRMFKFAEVISLPKQKLEQTYSPEILPEVYKQLLKTNQTKINQNAENIKKIAITDTYTVASKVREIFKELIRRPKFVFNKLYTLSRCNKQEVVTAFTGVLELSRRSKIITEQEELFGDIIIEKKKKVS